MVITRRTGPTTAVTSAITSSGGTHAPRRWSRTCPIRTSGIFAAAVTITRKIYAAYRAAVEHVGQPTVILAKTIKGFGLGPSFQGRNATHQMKKMTLDNLKSFRDSLGLTEHIPDAQLEADPYQPPYFHPGDDADEIKYLKDRRHTLGGFVPERRITAKPLPLPEDKVYDVLKRGSGKQAIATTMAFVRLVRDLFKDPGIGSRIVPIIPDEARTFGMDFLLPDAKDLQPVRSALHGR